MKARSTIYFIYKDNKVHSSLSISELISWTHHATHFHPQFSSVIQSCPTLCDPMNRSTPGLPGHHQPLESMQTHVHCVGDAIQPFSSSLDILRSILISSMRNLAWLLYSQRLFKIKHSLKIVFLLGKSNIIFKKGVLEENTVTTLSMEIIKTKALQGRKFSLWVTIVGSLYYLNFSLGPLICLYERNWEILTWIAAKYDSNKNIFLKTTTLS